MYVVYVLIIIWVVYRLPACLLKNNCSKLIHINSKTPEYVPAYGRIRGFEDTCVSNNIPYNIITADFGNSYTSTVEQIRQIFDQIEEAGSGKKGIFLSNDTYANIIFKYSYTKIWYTAF